MHVPNEPGEALRKERIFGMTQPSLSFSTMRKALTIAIGSSVDEMEKKQQERTDDGNKTE